MDTLSEMRSWLRLGDEDTARLHAAIPVVEPHVVRIIDLFYSEIQRHPGASAVLDGPAQVERLKGTLRQWLREVFEGPHDAAYMERRQAIGRMHVKVRLPNRYMFLAMHVVESELVDVFQSEVEDPRRLIASLRRVLSLDLALMTGTYVSGREAQQLDALQVLLVRHLRLTVFLIDTAGVVRSATLASARLCGVDDPVGSHWTSVLPEGLVVAAGLERELEQSQSRGREVTLPRVDVPQADGSVRSFRIHLVPLEHDLAAHLLQLEELTDAVEMEARVRRSEALAQLGALSAAVSHELRNPLAGISGALQVLSQSLPEDAPHRPILRKVDSEVRRLNDLVGDLLAFARPRQAVLVRLNLRAVVVELLDLVKRDHKGVVFSVVGTGSAHADADLVHQILHNLLRNSVDAVGERGEVRVEVAPGRIRVSDSGGGVPEAMRDRLFEPFETSKTRGTGLGLAISARNAQAMGGTLRLAQEGELGGACFVLSLAEPPL